MNRTEIGCDAQSGEFNWMPFDRHVISDMGGSHHRKILVHAVLSGYVDDFQSQRSEKILKEQICKPSQLSAVLNCNPVTKQVGVRTFNLRAKIQKEKVWNCD